MGGDFLSIAINGFATQSPDNMTQGALSVSLGPNAEAEFEDPGNYWIFDLGPIVDDQYQYSLVSNDNQQQLYVLARDPETFDDLYAEEVLNVCEEMGFTGFLNKPRRSNQISVDTEYTGNSCYHRVPNTM